jgi:hypothetical protein
MRKYKYLFFPQGVYYLLTGVWPLIHIESFLYVTGPKTDVWLVKAISTMFVCIGLVLSLTVLQYSSSFLITVLAVTTALSLLIIDLYYSLNGIISPVYLIDGIVQLAFLLLYSFNLKS